MNIELLRRRQPAFSAAHEVVQIDVNSAPSPATDIKSKQTAEQGGVSKQSQPDGKCDLPVIKEGFGYALLSSMGITEETPLIPYEGQSTSSTCPPPAITDNP